MADQDSSTLSGSKSPAGFSNSPAAPELPQSGSEEKFLRALSKLMRDRVLYPEKHPQILVDVSSLQSTVPLLFAERPERIFVFIEDQIFIDDRRLATASAHPPDAVKIFRDKRIDALVLREGLSLEEIKAFLDDLLGSKPDNNPKPAFRSPHIEIRELSSKDEKKAILHSGLEGQGAATSKPSLNKMRFSDETKIIREIYTEWNASHGSQVSMVFKIMNALEKGLYENYQSFIPLADLKSYDEYTYVHAINLAILTMAQAESFGFPREAVHAFGIGALLHDVGKTQVSLQVLNKQGQLTPEEFEEMKKHPVLGASVLLQYPEVPPIAAIVAYEHHLKYDGSGYPVMKQKRMPHIASRFTSISDHFDAMRSNRPYREAMPPEKIFEVMQGNRGTALDPNLLDHFMAFMKTRKII
jgi:putative nucleotidyltransferase with HDIG domain